MDATTSPSPTSLPAEALTLDQLRLFLAVLDAGSFSAAARALGRAQSAVSHGIANLERQLDVVLFDRARRTPTLTAAGEELAAEARAVCAQVDRLRARARGIARGVEALGAVAELVVAGTCSVGIGAAVPGVPETIERRPLAKVTMVHVAAAKHPLARRRGPLGAQVVREHVQIVLADRSRLSQDYAIGVFSGRTWRVLDLAAKHALPCAGLGWGGMPLHVVPDDLRRKRLVRLYLVEAGGPSFEAVLYAMHRGAEPLGPAASWLCRGCS